MAQEDRGWAPDGEGRMVALGGGGGRLQYGGLAVRDREGGGGMAKSKVVMVGHGVTGFGRVAKKLAGAALSSSR
jgi:hypothetical protein